MSDVWVLAWPVGCCTLCVLCSEQKPSGLPPTTLGCGSPALGVGPWPPALCLPGPPGQTSGRGFFEAFTQLECEARDPGRRGASASGQEVVGHVCGAAGGGADPLRRPSGRLDAAADPGGCTPCWGAGQAGTICRGARCVQGPASCSAAGGRGLHSRLAVATTHGSGPGGAYGCPGSSGTRPRRPPGSAASPAPCGRGTEWPETRAGPGQG